MNQQRKDQYAECVRLIVEAGARRGMVARTAEDAGGSAANGLTIAMGNPSEVPDASLAHWLEDADYLVCSVDPCVPVGVQTAVQIERTPRHNYVFILTAPENHAEWTRRILALTGRAGVHLMSRRIDAATARDIQIAVAIGANRVGGVH